MRVLDYLLGGLALLALPVLVWWGIYQSSQSAVNLQARLEAQARSALETAGIDWASVRMEGQKAILSGAAPSADAMAEAARVVLRSNGAGGVIFGGVTMVESRVDSAQAISPYVWRASKSEDGRIILSGYAPSKAIRANLVEEARLVGRAPVDDEMQVAPGAPTGNFQGVARLALVELARLDQGEVVLTDHRLVLRGAIADPAERARVRAAIAGVAAPFRGQPILHGEAVWRAQVSGNVLKLSGIVPDEAQRRLLLATSSQAFGGEIVDEMVSGEAPAEGWLAGALAGLPEFSRFVSGEMSFDPAGGVFTFEGEASPSTLYYLKEDMARDAGRWKTVIGAEMTRIVPELPGNVFAATAEDPALPCQGALDAALGGGDIRFVGGGASIARDSRPALDRIAAIAGQCDPDMRFEVEASNGVQASELADFLASAGVPRSRLAAISSGRPTGEASNQSEDTGADSLPPVRIRVLERSKE